MTSFVSRRRLLAGSALLVCAGLGWSAPASAQCVRTGSNLTCDTTITDDTINDGSSPASDRAYNLDLSGGNATATILAGRNVTGAGLAIATSPTGAATLSIVNNGTVQLDAGRDVFMGGSTALTLLGEGAANLAYSGTGSVLNLSATSPDALRMISFGTGNITANVGGSVVSNFAGSAIGLFQGGTSGNVAVTVAQNGIVRSGYYGIQAGVFDEASSGQIDIINRGIIASPSGAAGSLDTGILAQQDGRGVVSILNAGSIGSASDRAENAIVAEVRAAASDADIIISSTGALYATERGILATTAGTGDLSVDTGSSAFNLAGGTNARVGIETTALGGFTTISVGSGGLQVDGVGIRTMSSSGAQSISVAGVIDVRNSSGNDGIQAGSGSGAIAINVLSGGAIRGSDDAISIASGGAKTITIASGATLTGNYGIYAGGSGTTTIVNGGSLSGQLNTVLAMNADVGAFTITNQASGLLSGGMSLGNASDALINAGTFNLVGTADFRGGNDALTNQGSGTINVTAGSGFSGLETLTNAATLNALGGLTLGGTATTLTNSGILNLGGTLGFTGGGSLVSSGTVNAVGGTATVSVPSFTNSGIVNLRDGAANDTLTVTGNYVGSGNAVLRLDYAQSSADRLVISGNASGSTRLELTAVPGTIGIDPTGLLLVDVAGSTAANAFTFSGSSGNPLIDFSLQQRGADVFLVALPNSAGLRPLAVANVVTDLWYQGADMVAAVPRREDGEAGFWAQGSLGRDLYGEKAETLRAFGNDVTLSTRQRNDRLGLQAGAELPLRAAAIGATVGWQRAESRFGGVDTVEAKGWNLGIYGRIASAGLTATLLAKIDRNDVDLDRDLFTGLVGAPDSRSLGLSGEASYRFGPVAIQGGLALVRTRIDGFQAAGLVYRFDDQTSARGHVGARYDLAAALGAHVDAKLYREFAGDTDLTLTSGTSDKVTGRYRGTWGRIGIGIGGTSKLPALISAWADVGDVRGAGLTAGLAF